MQTNENITILLDTLSLNDPIAMKKLLDNMNTVDIALFLETLPIDQAVIVFRMLTKEDALHVFSELDSDMQQTVIESISDKEVGNIIDDLWVDDAVDMLEEMPATLVKKVLRSSSPEARNLINQYLRYSERSVGSIMTAEFVDFPKDMPVKDAIETLRQVSHIVETIYTIFITDGTRILLGAVELKDILLSDDTKPVGDLIPSEPIYVYTSTDKEEAIRTMVKYDLISMPVVDNEHRLVGIVTVDDAVDVMIEEDTEDFERMASLVPSEKPYLKTSAFALAKNRFPWLLVSLATNIIISFVVDYYSPVYAMMPILVNFIPMLMGTGGNAGSQTSTLVIRGMAVGEIHPKNFLTVLWKEVRVCLVIGTALSILCFGRILLTNPHEYLLAFVVSVALFSAIFVGKTTGAALPIMAKICKVDPALMAAPLITTVVDIMSLMVYFVIARQVFSLY